MNLPEYEGKRLFAAAGLPVLPSRLAATAAEAEAAAADLGCPVMVKVQVRAGGRGKAGGIRRCKSPAGARAAAAELLGATIGGERVDVVLVETAVDRARELYLAILSSRPHGRPVLLFSRLGGMDVEQAARHDAQGFITRPIDPLLGVLDYQARDVVAAAAATDLPGGGPTAGKLAAVVRKLWTVYRDSDATLAEINPLAVTGDGEVVCLDSKVAIDENALFRHPELGELARAASDERSEKARAAGLSFVPLDGDIGVIGNGAGLVMSLIDQIAAAGGAAADFCDIGGGAQADAVAAALDIVLSAENVAAVLVSVFGGITRCDEVAEGIGLALGRVNTDVPVVVRLAGNAAAEGCARLVRCPGENVTVVRDVGEAVKLVVNAARLKRALDPTGRPV